MVTWIACVLREDLVDDDVDLLYVERSLCMMCSAMGSIYIVVIHKYKYVVEKFIIHCIYVKLDIVTTG
jgi:hypothetical protein